MEYKILVVDEGHQALTDKFRDLLRSEVIRLTSTAVDTKFTDPGTLKEHTQAVLELKMEAANARSKQQVQDYMFLVPRDKQIDRWWDNAPPKFYEAMPVVEAVAEMRPPKNKPWYQQFDRKQRTKGGRR